MKKLFLAVFASTLFAHIGLSDTYVWEDYDDFSGSSLDTSKWDVGYFSGGEAASTNGDVATLSGSGYTGSDLENVPSIWQTAAAQSTGQSNSGIFVKETDIYGIEVEVSIPSSGNSQNVGFIVETHPADGSTYNGIELAWRENGLNWSYENENPSTAQILELSQEADFDTSYTLSVIHTGSRMELHINGTRVANLNSNFTPNHWLIGSFNDDGKTFNVSIDNVRVLRRSTSDSLDGTTLFLDSDDPVTLTLAFENGTITSTFEDGGEDSGTETEIPYDYIIVDQNSFSITETSKLDGSYITFDQSTGRGKLFDFKSDGQIDESGTWEFSFERFDWEDYDDFSGSSLDTSNWGTMYFYGGVTPTIENGKMSLSSGGLNLNAQNQFKEGWEQIIATWNEQDPEVFAYLTDESVVGISAEVSLPYDSSVGAAAHLNFNNQNSENGASIEIMYDGGSPNIYLEIEGQDDAFPSISAELGRTYKFSIYYHDDSLSLLIDDQQVGSVTIPNLSPNMIGIGAYHDEGQSFDIPVDNVRVLRRSLETQGYAPDSIAGKAFVYTEGLESEVTTFSSDGKVYGDKDGEWTFYTYEKLSANVGKVIYTFENEQTPMPEEEILTFTSENAGTFEWSEYSDATMSTKTDNGSGIFSISDSSVEPESVNVVLAPNGLPVVVQVGDEYQWNDTLDGVTLWGVGYDNEELNNFTFSYSTSVVEAVLGLVDQVTNPSVTQAYTITEEGYLEHTESSGPQYFKVHSVENGKIVTTPFQDKNEASSSTDPHDTFFTTRAAAEAFYNSKINYAPDSLVGESLQITETDEFNNTIQFNYFFTPEDAYFWDTTLGTPKLRGIPYSYEKNSSTEASLSLIQDFGEVRHQISFSSSLLGSTTWEDNFTNGIGSIQILNDEYAPDSLIGWILDAGSSGTYKFTTDSAGVFYHQDESNYSNSELSNITYTWEIVGPGMGKLTTSLDEVTWLFFETHTTGYFDWEELEADSGGSGEFSLLYYSDGHAHESLAGDRLSLGTTTYVFSSDTSVNIHSQQGATISEYAYLRNGDDEGILSIGDSIFQMDFFSSGYGRVEKGGSGYFRVLQNWATKGWVWYDHFPWAYSDNMQDWFYQILFINDDNESDMAHYQVWDNQWNIPDELHYSGESNFSSADAYYWEDYDDFSGSELNNTKWDVAWWDGGTAPSIDQVNNRVEFTKGSSYEANLTDLMNVPNPNAESEYSYGYDASYGFAPSTISDMTMNINEYPDSPESADEVYFSNSHQFRYDEDIKKKVSEPYSYERIGPNTGRITIQEPGGVYIVNLTFTSQNSGIGTWEETEYGDTYSGNLTFDIVFSPHSLLEFSQSDDIEGIEFELMIPNGAPDQTCIGLFAVDYNAMFNASSEEQEEGAIKFDLDLCYFNGLVDLEFNHKDPETGEENSTSQSAQLGVPQKIAFYYRDERIYFFHNDQIVKDYSYKRGSETFLIRAENETNLDFSSYIQNVRVLRKKSYPQGWMWMDYYPWAYSHDSNSWLYFQLAKDVDGQPGMIYWDTATKDWDIYHPALSPEQSDDQEKLNQSLNQH